MTTIPRALAMAAVPALVLCAESACAARAREMTPAATPPDHAQLWQAPDDIARRDLYLGPGGPELVPAREPFVFVAHDRTGTSPGFDVRDNNGRAWDVKQGPEAQSEVTASRILWAIGYHQPPAHYVDQWTLTGEDAGSAEGPQSGGRFRPDRPSLEREVGVWAWDENPFIGSRPFGGLIVANLILNSWDWKASNNKIYDFLPAATRDQIGTLPMRRYVARDLGASLGKTSYPTLLKWFRLRGFGQGSRNDVDDFESQPLLLASDDGRPHFDYRGIYDHVVEAVTFEDVRWTCALISRLSDKQLDDAFRAGGFSPSDRARYIRKLKEKTQQGLRTRED
ncbi:MAG TPA: hypothetical protein VFV98_02355 [Vicinamibacterales bacterium]|nr:hypothetical protein [Vicinamibacterales bacterium]